MCWADTLVHPIEAEDNAIALIRFESGAIGQFEVSWTFRGGMDLRDEVAGTEGTIWLEPLPAHRLRGVQLRRGRRLRRREGRVVERLALPGRRRDRASSATSDMFTDMFDAIDEGRAPMETLLRRLRRERDHRRVLPRPRSRGSGSRSSSTTGAAARRRAIARPRREHDGKTVIKEEQMPDGRRKLILKDEATGTFSDLVTS